MPEQFDPKLLEERLARADTDRAMAARFAAAADRERLIALYAFNNEVARVRERVTEPAIGDMRLAWWREAVDEIYDPRRSVRWHEAARALEQSFAGRPPPRLWIDRLINVRARDLDADPFTSLKELRDYAEASAGTLMRAAAWMLAPGQDLDPAAERAATHAGVAWALTGLLRAAPVHAEQGRPALPVNLRELTGAGADPDRADSLTPIVEMAWEEYRIARDSYAAVPAECAPACLYAALIPAYLNRIEKGSGPLPARAGLSRLSRQIRLVAAAARGRI